MSRSVRERVHDWRQCHESQTLRAVEPGWADYAVAGSALLAMVGLFWAGAGPAGVAVGVGTIVVWSIVGPAYAVAAGAVMLSAVAVESRLSLATAALGFLALMLVPVLRAPEPQRYAAVAGLTAVVFVVETWLLVSVVSLWLAGVLLLSTLGVVAYLFDRYHRLALGLLDPESERGEQPTPDGDTEREDSGSERLIGDETGAQSTDTAPNKTA